MKNTTNVNDPCRMDPISVKELLKNGHSPSLILGMVLSGVTVDQRLVVIHLIDRMGVETDTLHSFMAHMMLANPVLFIELINRVAEERKDRGNDL